MRVSRTWGARRERGDMTHEEQKQWRLFAEQAVSRRSLLRGGVIGGLGLATAALIGCGDDDDDDDGGGGGAATATTTTAQATAAPADGMTPTSGQTYSVAGVPTYTYQHLDPAAAVWTAGFTWPTHTMLVTLDASSNDGADWEVQPGFAESWEQDSDTSYVFHLRQGVKFHNISPAFGREATSADVKFSLDRIGTEHPQFFRQLEMKDATVTTPDDYTVRIAYPRPQAPFWNRITTPGTVVLPVEIQDTEGGLIKSGNPVAGTGPFIHKDFVENETFTVTKNPDYFEPGLPYLDGMEWQPLVGQEPIFVAFKSGDIDVARISSRDVREEAKRLEGVTVDIRIGLATHWIAFNTKVEPFGDQRVRYAISLAHPRQEIIDVALLGPEGGQMLGPAGLTPNVHGNATYSLDELKTRPGYRSGADVEADRAEARKLLSAAGVEPYTGILKYTQHLSAWPYNDTLATILIEAMADIGMDLTLDPYSYSDTLVNLANKDYGMYHTAQHGNGLDVNNYLEFYFAPDGPRNYGEWLHPKYDELDAKQNLATDPEERNEIVFELVKLLETEVPRAPTMVVTETTAIQSWLHNYYVGAASPPFQVTPQALWRDK